MNRVESLKNKSDVVHIRINKELKKSAKKTLETMGLDLTTAITIYLKKIVSEQEIPFKISADPFYSESNMKFLKESIKELEEGKTKRMTIEELRNTEVDDEN